MTTMSEETKQQRKQARAAATKHERARRTPATTRPTSRASTPAGPITTRCAEGDHRYCARVLTCRCACHEISTPRHPKREEGENALETDDWVNELRNNIRV